MPWPRWPSRVPGVYSVLHGTLDKVLVASQDIYARLVTRLETKVEQVLSG
jgi:hypothetical protein